MLAALPAVELPALRVVVCGGEPVSAEIVARWGAGRRLFNTYGPTEATVSATMFERAQDDAAPPPIGRAFAAAEIHLLDANGEPVPDGTPGEIHIGGPGVARGYLGRPELSAARFISSPFQAEMRLFRTGDRALRRPDGNLEFLGRADQQVKIRGLRAERSSARRSVRGSRKGASGRRCARSISRSAMNGPSPTGSIAKPGDARSRHRRLRPRTKA